MRSVTLNRTASRLELATRSVSSFLRAAVEGFGWKTLLLLAFTTGTAYFLLYREFGLYSDDYTFISRPFAWDLEQLLGHIAGAIRTWPIGRPIGFILPQVAAYAAAHAGGLPSVYLIGFGILTLNSFLVYLVARQVAPEFLALIAALAYALFPADTTRPFAMHATGLQTSMTFMLVAALLYLAEKRPLAYVIAAASLLTYESGFMPFLAVPLLKPHWERGFSRVWLKHVAVCLALLAAAFLYRRLTNDERTGALSAEPFEMALRAVGGMVMGPIAALSTFPSRFLTPWLNLDQTLALVMLGAFVVLGWRLLKSQPASPAVRNASRFDFNFDSLWKWLRATHPHILVASLVMLALGYSLSFTHFPPIAIQGQATSVHLAATFGASLLFGWICYALWTSLQLTSSRIVFTLCLAFYLSTLVGFGFLVQRDYRSAWSIQKQFWQQTLDLVPDLEDGTVILAVQDGIPQTQYINATSWADPLVLPEIFAFPKEWETPPRVYPVSGDWASQVSVQGGEFELFSSPWPGQWVELRPGQVVVLESENGKLVRLDQVVEIQGHAFQLKPLRTGGNPAFAQGVLYQFLIRPGGN